MAKESGDPACAAATSGNVTAVDAAIAKHTLTPELLTVEAFSPYGEVLVADDGPDFRDVTLNLANGTPRIYLMALPSTNGRLAVRALTRHQRTTQVLGSVGGIGWYMGVCPPSPVAVSDDEAQTVPDMERLRVFYVPGDCAIKLHEGTWHEGPLFEEDTRQLFYNLELDDTNVTDHHTVDLLERFGKAYTVSTFVGDGAAKRKKD